MVTPPLTGRASYDIPQEDVHNRCEHIPDGSVAGFQPGSGAHWRVTVFTDTVATTGAGQHCTITTGQQGTGGCG